MQTLHRTHRELGIYFSHSACKHPRDAHGSSDDTWVSLPVQINRMMVAQGLTDRLRKDGMEQPWVGIIIQDLVPSQPHTWPRRIVWHPAASLERKYCVRMSSWAFHGPWLEERPTDDGNSLGEYCKGPRKTAFGTAVLNPRYTLIHPVDLNANFIGQGKSLDRRNFFIENVFFFFD